MPATSVAQQQFFGAELRRKRRGLRTRTGLAESKLREFASTSHKGLSARRSIAHGRARREMRRSKRGTAGALRRSVAARKSAGGY